MDSYKNCAEFQDFYVVFQDEVSLWWLKILKPGFRHCYILLPLEKNKWLEINPMSNRIFFFLRTVPEGVDFLDSLCCEKRRCLMIKVSQFPPLKPAPLGFFSCVEFVKRCLDIHDRTVITPYQLYKKLKIVGKKS